MSRYKHLFFDLDHTLWDFEANSKKTWSILFKNNQLDEIITSDFDAFYASYSAHNHKLWQRYHHGYITQEQLRYKRMWHTFLDFKFHNETLANQLSDEYLDILPLQDEVFDYTYEIIEYLQAKDYKLHLITNGFEKVQRRKLVNCGLDKSFEAIVTSEAAMALKPKKEIFEYALKAAGANLNESIMLGDNLDADIKGAMNVEMDTVFVNHIKAKTDLKPTYIIQHLKELEDIF